MDNSKCERRVSGRRKPTINYNVEVVITDAEDDEPEDGPATPVKRRRTRQSVRQSVASARSPQATLTPEPKLSPKSSNRQSERSTLQSSLQSSAKKKRRVAPVKAGSDLEYQPQNVNDDDVASAGDIDEVQVKADPSPEPAEDGLVDSRRYEKSKLPVQGFDMPLDVIVDNHWVYLFYRFCAERHEMYYRRAAGVARDALTSDETMKSVHIGNVFRQLDPSSLMMRDKIIADGDQSVDEVCCEFASRPALLVMLMTVRVFLYCQFYNADSWAVLCGAATGGIPTWKYFADDLPAMEDALHDLSLVQKKKIYLGGFQLVPPTVYFDPQLNRNRDKNIFNYAASLRLVMAMMESGLPQMLSKCRCVGALSCKGGIPADRTQIRRGRL